MICVSYTVGCPRRTIQFEDASTDELRKILAPISPKVGRNQLLALCRNRYKCGYYIEVVTWNGSHWWNCVTGRYDRSAPEVYDDL